MTNTPTIFSFGYEADPTEVSADGLHKTIQAAQALFRTAWSDYGEASFTLYHIAAPEAGCIKFRFRADVQFSLKVPVSKQHQPRPMMTRLSEVSSIGAFLFAVTYGGGGIFDKVKADDTLVGLSQQELQLVHSLRAECLNRRVVRDASDKLRAEAKSTGCRRFVIHVTPDEPTVIYDEAQEAGPTGPDIVQAIALEQVNLYVRADAEEGSTPARVYEGLYMNQQMIATVAYVRRQEDFGDASRVIVLWPENDYPSPGSTYFMTMSFVSSNKVTFSDPTQLIGKFDGVAVSHNIHAVKPAPERVPRVPHRS